MNTSARLSNVGGALMYVSSALFLARTLITGQELAAVACFLFGLAGGLFLRAGAQGAVQRADRAV